MFQESDFQAAVNIRAVFIALSVSPECEVRIITALRVTYSETCTQANCTTTNNSISRQNINCCIIYTTDSQYSKYSK